jgi:hypothetical protein
MLSRITKVNNKTTEWDKPQTTSIGERQTEKKEGRKERKKERKKEKGEKCPKYVQGGSNMTGIICV